MVCRRHWLAYAADTVVVIILFILPYAAYRMLGLATSITLTDGLQTLATFFYLTWFLLLWAYFFVAWTNVYLDAWVITDRRIVDIEQTGLFHRSVSDFRIEKIQNIMVKEVGFIAHSFGYGSIIVETAGERIKLEFDLLPNPTKVRDLISECHDKCLARLSTNPDSRDLATGD